MNIGKLPIALPQLRGEFGLSLTAAGWLAAAFSMLAMVCGMPIGIPLIAAIVAPRIK